ncbi:biotin--[acetyl-CoA-carboxylase] ligase [Gorillibacterium sp. CAU 1737]|uniref:biotin--[acetyl-CoA-carboxylase] ligase n=1 Tax=Gorillibacterium sp. CAU 1737 TaxID=3140362 RepID=UPI0032603172
MEKQDRLDEERLQSAFTSQIFGRTLRVYESVGSTQDEARSWAIAGAPNGSLVMAEQQRSGRGRMGRVWHSPKGKGLWMSAVIRSGFRLEQAPPYTLVTAVAVCRAIRELSGANARLKWPNDVRIDGKKIAGILVELISSGTRVDAILVGIGIGVNLDEEDYPDELKEKATSLKLATGSAVDRTELAALIMKKLEELTAFYLQEGFEPIRSLWEALSDTLGNRVQVESPLGTIAGTAIRLDSSGALVVRTDSGEEHILYSGDVTTFSSP